MPEVKFETNGAQEFAVYCRICNARYVHLNDVRKHIRSVHKIDQPETFIRRTYSKCPFYDCTYSTMRFDSMNNHFKRSHWKVYSLQFFGALKELVLNVVIFSASRSIRLCGMRA